MSEKLTSTNITIKRCSQAINGGGCTARRKIGSEKFLAFKLASWLMFVEETDPCKPKENAQLTLF